MALESASYVAGLVSTNWLQMRPAKPAHNLVALLRRYTVVLSEFGKGYAALFVSCFDFLYLCGRQFVHAVRFAGLFCQPVFGMKNILPMRHPFKVIDAVVRRIKINVINLASFRFLAYKNDGNQAMHKRSLFASVHAKLNAAMSILSLFRLQDANVVAESPNSPNPAYSPKVGNLIAGFVAGNRPPDFFHIQSPIIGKLRVMWHGNRHGNRFSGATLAMQGEF